MIEVVDHDPGWAEDFVLLRDTYRAAFRAAGVVVGSIEHVGSTAVPGLVAKPVIDCDVVVREDQVAAASDVLVGLGFEARGEQGIPQRWAFVAPPDLPRTHTYVVVAGSLALRNHLGVRDVLRRDRALREEYARVKRALAATAPDTDAYVAGKSAVVQRLLEAAGLTAAERAACDAQQPRSRS